MKKLQVYRTAIALIPTLVVLLTFEVVLYFDQVMDPIRNWVGSGENDIATYLIVFAAIYLQGTVLPIPAYIPLNACVSAGILDTSDGLWEMFGKGSTWILFAVVFGAYLLGIITAYFAGYFFGSKAVKWIASSEEDYEKWRAILNGKGRWFYFLTVLLPVFPDDLLCLVCGSLRMHFGAFMLANVVGRGIGLVFMFGALALLGLMSEGFPWAILVESVALAASIAVAIYLRVRLKASGELPGKDEAN